MDSLQDISNFLETIGINVSSLKALEVDYQVTKIDAGAREFIVSKDRFLQLPPHFTFPPADDIFGTTKHTLILLDADSPKPNEGKPPQYA